MRVNRTSCTRFALLRATEAHSRQCCGSITSSATPEAPWLVVAPATQQHGHHITAPKHQFLTILPSAVICWGPIGIFLPLGGFRLVEDEGSMADEPCSLGLPVAVTCRLAVVPGTGLCALYAAQDLRRSSPRARHALREPRRLHGVADAAPGLQICAHHSAGRHRTRDREDGARAGGG